MSIQVNHIYVGKVGNEITGLAAKVGLVAAKVVKSLAETLYHAGRNITADSYFTDFALASELLLKKTIYVGTLRKNKSDIPPEFQANKTRPVGSTLFGFDKDTTLVSFVTKKSKSVLLLSTMHHDGTIDDQTGKPDIILYYNKTKGAMDQMCHTYSVQRKTRRWPLAYFMNLLNLGGLNAYITFVTQNPHWCLGLSYRRRQFLEDLGLDLVQPIMERRAMSFVSLAKPTQQVMSVCGITSAASVAYNQDEAEQGPTKAKRKRWYKCSLDRKSSRVRTSCKRTVCAHHSTKSVEIKCQSCL